MSEMKKAVHDTFEHIKYNPLRLFNAFQMAYNLSETHPPVVVKEYLENFSDEERKAFYVMGIYVEYNGWDSLRKAVLRDFEPELATIDGEFIEK